MIARVRGEEVERKCKNGVKKGGGATSSSSSGDGGKCTNIKKQKSKAAAGVFLCAWHHLSASLSFPLLEKQLEGRSIIGTSTRCTRTVIKHVHSKQHRGSQVSFKAVQMFLLHISPYDCSRNSKFLLGFRECDFPFSAVSHCNISLSSSHPIASVWRVQTNSRDTSYLFHSLVSVDKKLKRRIECTHNKTYTNAL